jgi:hypothetical protein
MVTDSAPDDGQIHFSVGMRNDIAQAAHLMKRDIGKQSARFIGQMSRGLPDNFEAAQDGILRLDAERNSSPVIPAAYSCTRRAASRMSCK